VAQAIWEGQAILGTDGSVRADVATYAWVLAVNKDGIEANVKGGGLLPRSAQYMQPYSKRPEAAALYASLIWIRDLLRRYPDACRDEQNPPTLPIPVDNKAVIDDIHQTINDLTPTFRLLSPDYDIIQATRQLIAKLPINIDIFHVKSHQDRRQPYDTLTPFAQINILADHHADALHDIPPPLTGLFPTWIPGTRASLFHGQQQVTKDIPTYLRAAKHAPILKQYLIDHSQDKCQHDTEWDEEIFDNIAWMQLGETFKQHSPGQCLQLSKYMHGILLTLKHLSKFDNKINGRCFNCGLLWGGHQSCT
jgi:hypothetical protein